MVSGSRITMRVRHVFFDDPKIKRVMDDRTRRVYQAFGREVRRLARASVKESKGPSSPGQPPHSHMGARRRVANKKRKSQGKAPIRGGFTGLKLILYSYDPAGKSVIIGPASNRTRSLTIPEILEKGKDPQRKVEIRPFMGPAFEAQKQKLPSLWASVGKF